MNSTFFRGKLKVWGFAVVFSLPLVSLNPAWGGSANPHLQKAKAHSLAGQWAESIQEFQKELAENPDNGFAHAGLGVALSGINRHKEAMLEYDKALKLGYDNGMFRYNRGYSFARLNLLEEAETEFLAALKMDSRIARAKYDLGIIYMLQGRMDEARAQVAKLYKKHRKNKLAKKLFNALPPKYKTMSVDNGGSLTGRVTLSGDKPPPRIFQMINTPNIEFCSRMSDGKGHRLVHDFQIDEDKGLESAIVAILGIKKGKPFPMGMYSLKVRLCHAKDYAIGISNGVDFLIENMDPVKHEIATYEIDGPAVYQKSNKSVLPNSSQVRSTFAHPDTKEFLLRCNLHPFLQTQALIVENPYFVVTDSKGQFSIENIPPGTYEVIAWHPYIPTQKKRIAIKAGQETKTGFEFNAKDATPRPLSHTLERNLFTVIYDRHEKFYGGKRVDDPIEVLQK